MKAFALIALALMDEAASMVDERRALSLAALGDVRSYRLVMEPLLSGEVGLGLA